MKQRCTFLDCGYFDGGECLGLCMQRRTKAEQPLQTLSAHTDAPDLDDFDAASVLVLGLIVVVLLLIAATAVVML